MAGNDSFKVEIVCDSPRHARGKVAKIRTYVRIQGRWSHFGAKRQRQWARRSGEHPGWTGEGAVVHMLGPDGFAPECKLCGKKLPAWTEEFWGTVLDVLAAQCVSRVSLQVLEVLASKI